VCELALQALSCRDPSKVYCILLNDKWTRFQIQQRKVGHVVEIHTLEQFTNVFSYDSPHNQDFLYELYQFKFLMHDNCRWNRNPYVGDIQLMDLSSFIYNQVIWKEDSTFYDRAEENSSLHIRDEYTFPMIIQEEYFGFVDDPRISTRIRKNQCLCITYFEYNAQHYALEVLMDYHEGG
jgi:hypothetical protein